jgi:ABC-2 type transport system ATP-binding protein
MAAAIETHGLAKAYGERRAVDGLDLCVEEGDVFGFLGPNGAGKSTTIRILLGLVFPSAGRASVFGHDVVAQPLACRRLVAGFVERPAFYGYLSAQRNMEIHAELAGGVPRARCAELLELVGLGERGGDRVKTYSNGMLERLGIAAALLGSPRVLILDEPTTGLDPQGIEEVRALVAELGRAGLTIFLSSHLLSEIERICTRAAIVRNGRVIAQGTIDELVGAERRYRVETDDPAAAARALRALAGVAVHGTADGAVQLELLDGATPTDVARAVLGAGTTLDALVPERRTLEEAFLEATEG